MPAAKLSITLSAPLAHMLEDAAKSRNTSKSALIEKAVNLLMEKMLEEE